MGMWHISIQGHGAHHNVGREDEVRAKDADVMAADFVRRLREAGHDVESATITTGSRDHVDGEPNEESGA